MHNVFAKLALPVALFLAMIIGLYSYIARAETNVSTSPTQPHESLNVETAPIVAPTPAPTQTKQEPKNNITPFQNAAATSAVLGFAVGSTAHLADLQRRGWLETPIPLAEIPDTLEYTVSGEYTLSHQATLWGIPVATLTALNPNYSAESTLTPGQKLVVQSKLSSSPLPYALGAPNRGRLLNGWLMPEGNEHSGYFLRTQRQRSWAAENTIASLVAGFAAYAAQYPDAPHVNVGDFSKRRGGKIKPHASHTNGRDVDIGYVHTKTPSEHHPEHFMRAADDNFDAEKTWFLLKSMIQTGEVKVIFMDNYVQKKLYAVAKKELTPLQLRTIFSYPHHKDSDKAIFKFWRGHRNHAHIRFICPSGQPSCRK